MRDGRECHFLNRARRTMKSDLLSFWGIQRGTACWKERIWSESLLKRANHSFMKCKSLLSLFTKRATRATGATGVMGVKDRITKDRIPNTVKKIWKIILYFIFLNSVTLFNKDLFFDFLLYVYLWQRTSPSKLLQILNTFLSYKQYLIF